MKREPPRLATLLLQRLGPNNSALDGDLAEAYRAGRSALWYGWQVLGTVVLGAGRELWVHKWLGVHAYATFLGVSVCLSYVWKILWFQTTLSARLQEFTVSVWGPQDPLVNAPYRWIFIFALLPLPIITGWILAKLHPRERGAAVLICCVVGTAMNTPRLLTLAGRPNAIDMYLHVTSMAIVVIGLVCGGLLAGSSSEARAIE